MRHCVITPTRHSIMRAVHQLTRLGCKRRGSQLGFALQEQTIKGPSSKSLTRIGGTALLHIGATHIATGLSGDSPRSKQQLRVCFAPCACCDSPSSTQSVRMNLSTQLRVSNPMSGPCVSCGGDALCIK